MYKNGLITRRSLVQIRSPQPKKQQGPEKTRGSFFVEPSTTPESDQILQRETMNAPAHNGVFLAPNRKKPVVES